MKTVRAYVYGDKESMYGKLISEGFSEEAAHKGMYATYEVALDIVFDEDGNVLNMCFAD